MCPPLVRILTGRGVAFVTYKTRANAEFAREAMMNQDLESNEIINVRWATADPNAIANRLDAEDDRLEAERVAKILAENQSAEMARQIEGAETSSSKRKVDEDGTIYIHDQNKKPKAEETPQPDQPIETSYEYTEEDLEDDYYQQQVYEEQTKRTIRILSTTTTTGTRKVNWSYPSTCLV